jgi:hypothetical protein
MLLKCKIKIFISIMATKKDNSRKKMKTNTKTGYSNKVKIAAAIAALTTIILMVKGSSDDNIIQKQATAFRNWLQGITDADIKGLSPKDQSYFAQIYLFITSYIPDWTRYNPIVGLGQFKSWLTRKNEKNAAPEDKDGAAKEDAETKDGAAKEDAATKEDAETKDGAANADARGAAEYAEAKERVTKKDALFVAKYKKNKARKEAVRAENTRDAKAKYELAQNRAQEAAAKAQAAAEAQAAATQAAAAKEARQNAMNLDLFKARRDQLTNRQQVSAADRPIAEPIVPIVPFKPHSIYNFDRLPKPVAIDPGSSTFLKYTKPLTEAQLEAQREEAFRLYTNAKKIGGRRSRRTKRFSRYNSRSA